MSRDQALSGSSDSDDRGFTGMTRDGTYRIENGKITYPVVDMRWNDSVLRVLNNVRASGRPTATGEFFAMVMPALKIEDFNFSSLSN
jgi:predicted Zn-dependent protease